MESLALFTSTIPSFSSSRFSHHLKSSPLSLHLKPISPLRSPIHQNPSFLFNSHPKPIKTYKPIHPISSSSTPILITDSKESKPQGAKLIPLFLSVAVGLIIRFLVPKPIDVTPQAWQLLSIFISTIAGLVLSPLPVGAWAFLGLTTSIITKTLTFSTAFGAFTNEVIWLIVISFFFARGFVKTGLGDRIATYFVKWLGKSTLGLSYGLTLSEALIAPAMPSTTARAGGVFLPIIKSLSLSAGSKPGDPSAKKLGAFLVQSQFQVK